MTRRGGLAFAAAILLTGCLIPPPPSSTPPSGFCRADPLDPTSRLLLDLGPGNEHHLTVSVWDLRTGCWYRYRPGQRVSTASVVKLEILGGTLLRAQREGRGLTAGEWKAAIPMITRSDNATASTLWSSLGGPRGMSAVGDDLGLAETIEVGPVWGLTTTTADDQARYAGRLLGTSEILDDSHRGDAWWLATSVVPAQRWGVGAGVPPGWGVGMKNGFASSKCCRWRINSVGYVADPTGSGYAVAILSDRWATMKEGVAMVDRVARIVDAGMTR